MDDSGNNFLKGLGMVLGALAVGALAVQQQSVPSSDHEIERLIQGLRGESFDNRRMQMLRRWGRPLTCEQARPLLKEFTFDGERRRAFEALNITDRHNSVLMEDVFTFRRTFG